MLAHQVLRALLLLHKDKELFEFTVKRVYNEFTRESRSGGGGFQVQDRLRVA